MVAFPKLAVVLVALTLTASTARAEEVVHEYEIIVTPALHQDAEFVVRIVYDADPPKQDGFKFFGTAAIDDVTVVDEAGDEVFSLEPPLYDEVRVEWMVPPPDDDGLQTVVISFRQPLEATYGWGARTATIPWADNFGLPVESMKVTAVLAGNVTALGCSYEGGSTFCSQQAPRLFPVSNLPLGLVDETFGTLLTMLMLLGGAALAVVRIRRWNLTLLDERGVLLPIEIEEPRERATNYRAPPPLPKPDEGEPQLPQDLKRKLYGRVFGAALLLLVPAPLAFFADGRSVWRISDLMAMSTTVAVLALANMLWSDESLKWIVGGLVAALSLVVYAAAGMEVWGFVSTLGKWLAGIILGMAFLWASAKHAGRRSRAFSSIFSGGGGFGGGGCSSCGGGGGCGGCGG